ncbi:MAG: hypothetical protein ACFFEK_03445 [Candidatus Thorarchaeota archaeon]
MEKLFSEDIRKRILAKITPTQKEIDQQNKVISALKAALSNYPSSENYSFSFIEAQGSTGRKQTQLRDAADVDLFVGLRPEDYSNILEKPLPERRNELDELMNSMVGEWFEPAVSKLQTTNVQKAYSQHPYLSLEIMNLEIDILGCFDIDSKALSENGPITAVDRTVHHTRYVADRLTDQKRDDVRIFKSFVKASHAYGDRCAVGRMGITGVALELLVLVSDSLNHAFNSLKKLDEIPIDPLDRPLKILRENPAFRDDYLILIDPTDHQRNIASSFTPRAYEWVKYRINKLVDISQTGRDDKMLEMTLQTSIPTKELPGWLKKHAIAREFKSDGRKHYTVLRDKLYSIANKIQLNLQYERTGEPRFGETLFEVYFEGDNYVIGILTEAPEISEKFVRRGPPTEMVEACDEFRKKHPEVEEREGFLWTTEKRTWRNPHEFTDLILKENTIEGLKPVLKESIISKRVLNILYRCILPIEPSFLEKITKHKEGNLEIPW